MNILQMHSFFSASLCLCPSVIDWNKHYYRSVNNVIKLIMVIHTWF